MSPLLSTLCISSVMVRMVNAQAVRSRICKSWPMRAFSTRPRDVPWVFSAMCILDAILVPTSHWCAPRMSRRPATRLGST
eukprot:15745939-Heterocapsa_arctica.AAC.2